MLYIISTPIGNLGDISLRALEVFEKVDFLLCEDTRNTGLMLKNLGIKNNPKLISFYDEVEEQKIPEVIKFLEANKEVALVSDAGTPLISDPGYKLINKCQKLGISYTALPGPSAVIDALVLSGLPSGRFSYLGFLPKKNGERKNLLEKYKEINGTKIIYESPFRVKKLLEEIKEVFGENCELAICRELTKKFEEIISGTTKDVLEKIGKKEIKGEIVVVIK
jgi:16S rRNA (cytidine1402-2'-O)-methyltransferase